MRETKRKKSKKETEAAMCNLLTDVVGLNKILFTHRNHKLNKQVQETQKQYAYLSVTYIQNDNHTDTYDSKMANYC